MNPLKKIQTLSFILNVSITVKIACLASKSLCPLIEAEVSRTTTISRGMAAVLDAKKGLQFQKIIFLIIK